MLGKAKRSRLSRKLGRMAGSNAGAKVAEEIRAALEAYIISAATGEPQEARDPGHRIPFHWPPHPVSNRYHVLPSEWTGRAQMSAHGELFDVRVARTPHGVFGRCDALWHEAKGGTLDEMLANLEREAGPLFARQVSIHQTLGLPGRFTGHIRDLPPIDLLRLLYCPDRDVASESRTEIETHASSKLFFPALLAILRDERHPNRRSAQWCVLDLFEDLPSFAETPDEEVAAVQAIRDLLWTATDDYARTMYKAGVVLGGHMPHEHGGPVLIEILKAPSKVGRRSAIHGLFHVVEWHQDTKPKVIAALRSVAASDPEGQLREYAASMAADIEAGNYEHVEEPVFPEEEF